MPVAREAEALKSMREAHPDLVILEGTVAGSKLLTEAKQMDSGSAVIMLMAGPPSVEQLVELMNQGVSDVLVSPLDINDVQTKVERALSRRSAPDSVQIRFHDLVGSSEKMQQVFRKLVKAAAHADPGKAANLSFDDADVANKNSRTSGIVARTRRLSAIVTESSGASGRGSRRWATVLSGAPG